MKKPLHTIALNIIFATATCIVLWAISQWSTPYAWLWKIYTLHSLHEIQALPYASNEQRLSLKLGEDYQYLLFLKAATPEDAVIYYPSQADFLTVPQGEDASPFSGKLIDKLTALRVLYPRRIVTEDEYGLTPWSQAITHVSIVGGKNKEKLPYIVPSDYVIGVLPVDTTSQNPFTHP